MILNIKNTKGKELKLYFTTNKFSDIEIEKIVNNLPQEDIDELISDENVNDMINLWNKYNKNNFLNCNPAIRVTLLENNLIEFELFSITGTNVNSYKKLYKLSELLLDYKNNNISQELKTRMGYTIK